MNDSRPMYPHRSPALLVAWAVATCVTNFAQAGGGPYLVKDINPGPLGSSPAYLVKVGNRLFFNADDGVHGQELWVTDGTEQSTYMVVDLVPGSDGSVPQRTVEFNGRVLFKADNNVDGFDLFVSDRTESGTVRLGDIEVGGEQSPLNDCIFLVHPGIPGTAFEVRRLLRTRFLPARSLFPGGTPPVVAVS